MRFSIRTCCAIFVILVSGAPGDDDIPQRFLRNVREIVQSNLDITRAKIKETALNLRQEYMGETQQNIELFFSQVASVFEEKVDELEDIAHDAIHKVSKEFGVEVEPERKCLKLLYDALMRTALNRMLLSEQDAQEVEKECERLRNKTEDEAYGKTLPLKKLVGRPQVARPHASNVQVDFHGYALDNYHRTTIVVDKRTASDSSYCYPDYVEHYSDALVDHISKSIVYYINRFGYESKLTKNVRDNTNMLIREIEKISDKTIDSLKYCPEIVKDIQQIYDLYRSNVGNILSQAANEY